MHSLETWASAWSYPPLEHKRRHPDTPAWPWHQHDSDLNDPRISVSAKRVAETEPPRSMPNKKCWSFSVQSDSFKASLYFIRRYSRSIEWFIWTTIHIYFESFFKLSRICRSPLNLRVSSIILYDIYQRNASQDTRFQSWSMICWVRVDSKTLKNQRYFSNFYGDRRFETDFTHVVNDERFPTVSIICKTKKVVPWNSWSVKLIIVTKILFVIKSLMNE